MNVKLCMRESQMQYFFQATLIKLPVKVNEIENVSGKMCTIIIFFAGVVDIKLHYSSNIFFLS